MLTCDPSAALGVRGGGVSSDTNVMQTAAVPSVVLHAVMLVGSMQ
jgi:hypothetical protein